MATVVQIGPSEHGPVGMPRNIEASRFVEQFAAAWARPTAERLAALLHPEVRLSAPMMRTTTGREASREELRRLIALWPDVRVEVERWSATDDFVFIEITMHATVAGRSLRIPAIDRFVLRDGLAMERVTYVAEPLSLLASVLMRPSGWLRWWRSGVGPPQRRCRLPQAPDGESGRS